MLAVQRELALPGGAGNVVRNLTALGAAAALVSVVGDDQAYEHRGGEHQQGDEREDQREGDLQAGPVLVQALVFGDRVLGMAHVVQDVRIDSMSLRVDVSADEAGGLDAAVRLRAAVRESDCAARLGGDEFAVLTTGLAAIRADSAQISSSSASLCLSSSSIFAT